MASDSDTILYIDDEAENLRGFQFLFKTYYKVFTAQSAEEGFEILRQEKVKIIIADQRMPKMTGVEFFQIVSKSHPGIIRIILTGYADIEAIIKAINEGNIFKYVTKPWNKEELKLILDNALWSYNIAEENRNLIQSLKEANRQLESANLNLENKVKARTEEILIQKREIELQRDLAKMQRDQIAIQNEELEKHRNQLEMLILERTADLVKAKDKAELSDKLKSAFLANLSHEIRTPMNAIMGFSQLLFHNEIEDRDKHEYLGLILVNSQHLLNLINEIIDISRIEVGEMSLTPDECSLSGIFRDILAQYKEQKILMGKSNVSLIVNSEIFEQNITILTDGSKLKQVLVNLIENALKFTDNGYIEFGVCENSLFPNDLVLYVKDTGIGISDEAKDFIFERFRKVEDSGTGKLYRGAGLGLAISKRLVELLGGRIWVESEIDKGSVFYFTLPKKGFGITDVGVTNNAVTADKMSLNWSGHIVLVAEDEPANYKYIEKVLSQTGIRLLWSKNGLETCEMVENNKNIDLVLMDIRMPVMDGYEATKRIKQSRKNMPIIAQTAYAMASEKTEILKAGCDDYIAKPYSEYELLKMMGKYIA